MKKTCMECGASIFGRSDKKYCSSDCRSQYHNSKNQKDRVLILKVNRKLMSNRSILHNLPIPKIKKIGHHELLQLGFNFDYLTNVYKTQKGKHYFFCYDYGYLKLSKDYYTIVKRQAYI